MVKVPGFLLKRLYVKGSLRNTMDGFQLSLKNTLGSGYAMKLLPLRVDGAEMPFESSFFFLDGREVPFSTVTKQTPFTLAMNRETNMMVRGKKLDPGPHKVTIGFTVVGLGDLTFDVADEVATPAP